MHLADYTRLVEEYLDYLQELRGYSPHTIASYKATLEKLKNHYQITHGDERELFDIRSYRLQIVSNHPKTISLKLTAIRGFIKFLNAFKEYNLHLMGDHAIKTPQTLPKPINKNYIDEILSVASLQEKTMVYLMYGVGLRISEVASIKLENISQEWIIIMGKGNKERQLPLLERVADIINDYINYANPRTYLFEKDHEPLSTHQIRYIINRLFKSKGIKVTPHQLRHTFATEMLNSDARMSDISKLLGHKTMHSTQIYTKLANSKKLSEYLASHPLCNES